MWDNDYRKNTIRSIILVALIILIFSALAFAMYRVHQMTQEEDARLIDVYVQQQQQQQKARLEGIEAINSEYERDMQTVADYLPGIVCWGDTVTAGSSGNISYPYILQKYINAYICDIYDFRSSIENADDYVRLDWDEYNVSIPVINMGGGAEDTNTVLGRAGAVPYVISETATIPAGTEPVQVEIASQNGKSVMPQINGGAGVNNVKINGIEGILSCNAGNNINQYFFTRCEPGSEITVDAGGIIYTSASEQYRNYIHVVCIGTYGGFDTAEELVQQTKVLLGRQTQNSGRYIVLGLCASGESYWNAEASDALDKLDSAMLQAFGNHYINVRKYLCEDGMSDLGVNPDADDIDNVRQGIVPECFRSASGTAELNGKAYRLIGRLVYERMESLGYFDEVTQELYIDETIKQLLRDDPNYLNRVIENSLR